jgi:hypothetical protein
MIRRAAAEELVLVILRQQEIDRRSFFRTSKIARARTFQLMHIEILIIYIHMLQTMIFNLACFLCLYDEKC